MYKLTGRPIWYRMIYVIGNPTYDVNIVGNKTIKDIGGTVTYSSLTIKQFGYSVGVVCKGDEKSKLLFDNFGIDTSFFYKTSRVLEFLNIYNGEMRKQKAKEGEKIYNRDIPNEVFASKAILLGPVLQEIDTEVVKTKRKGILMVDIQGFLRRLLPGGEVYLEISKNVEDVIRHCDILKASQEEAIIITSTHNIENSCKILYRMGPDIIIITMGEKGSCIYDGAKIYKFDAFKTVVVDPTGAGDVYEAAFLVKYLDTRDLIVAGNFATCAASLSLKGFSYTAIPTNQDVLRIINHL